MALALPLHEIVEKSSNPLLKIHPTWERIQLAEIAEILNGFAFISTKFNKSKGFPLLRIRDILNNSTACLYDGPYDSAYIVESGEYIIGMDGNFNFAKWEGPAALLNQRVCKITIQSNKFIPKFLEYVLPSYLKAINENTSSVTVKHLSSKSVGEIPIPLPPLPEQHRIVTKLEALLAQVNRSKDHLAEVPPLIKRFRQSVLAAACSGRLTEDWRREHPDVEPASELLDRIREERIRRYEEECRKAEAEGRRKPKKPKNLEVLEVDTEGLPELPEGWVWCKIENFISDFQPGFACGARDNCGYVQLRMNNIGLDGGVVLEKTLKVPIEKTNIEKYNLCMGDILFNNTNSVELIGKTALFRDEIQNCVFSNHITRIRPDVRVVTPKFLLYLFNDAYNKGIFRMMCHRFVGQAGISREKLLEHTLPLPPLLEQRAIVERVERLFHFADEVEQRVTAATTHANHLTQSILARAFRGELVPQDPRDEPASILLERIKHERAELKAKEKTQKRKSKTMSDFN